MNFFFESDNNLENSFAFSLDYADNEQIDFDIYKNYFKSFNEDNIESGISTKETMNKNKSKNKENKDEMNQIKDDEIFPNYSNEKDKNEKRKTNPLGRKKKGESGSSERHSKYSNDKLICKIKHLVLDNALKFINDKIKEIYNGKISHGLFIKKLLIINKKQISDVSAQFNKEFLNKTLGEIYSANISTRYNTYRSCHNSTLIKELTSEKDDDKQKYFKKLFSITFIDCLKHFIGSQKIEELEGLKEFENIQSQYEEDEDYLKSLKYYIMYYEKIINNKRARKPNRKGKEINEQ
jgi:hypothetical protein